MFRRIVVALAAIAVLSAVIMVPSIASGGTGPRPPTLVCSLAPIDQAGCWDCGRCAGCKD
jgi:hypothetical protein